MEGFFAVTFCHSILYVPVVALDPILYSCLYYFLDGIVKLFVIGSCFDFALLFSLQVLALVTNI